MAGRLMTGWMWRGIGACCCAVAAYACSPASSPSEAMEAAPAAAVTPAAATAAPTAAPLPAVRRASSSDFAVAGVLAPEQGVGLGAYLWEPEGVPDGPMTIVVDLNAQILYAYRGGIEIGRAAILYGADDKPTPTGTFPILEKKRDHVSNLYGAPMPYMQRLTWDGIAIHGSTVEYGSATHGCIGIPDEFAALLFAETRVGDRVLVTNDWMKGVYTA